MQIGIFFGRKEGLTARKDEHLALIAQLVERLTCNEEVLCSSHSGGTNLKDNIVATKPGLYANIHAKQERIKAGSGEKMRKPGTKGAPTAKAFKESAKTAKK